MKNALLCLALLSGTGAAMSAQNAPALRNLDGAWVVVGIERSDLGANTLWMSEWQVKGNTLKAAYKGILANGPMSNPNWQIRNFRPANGALHFDIVQTMSLGAGTIQLSISLTEQQDLVIKGQYAKMESYGNIYQNNNRGAIELRKVEANFPPALAAQMTGAWLNQGVQQSDYVDGPASFHSQITINTAPQGGLYLQYREKDAYGIESTVVFLLLYLRQNGDQIKMVTYSPKGNCMNPGCATLYEYTLTGNPVSGQMQGAFQGIFANQVIGRTQGTVSFKRLP